MNNLILHIPHSSRRIPQKFLPEFLLSGKSLEEELLRMTDAFTEELFPREYQRLVFPVSRLVCDPERFRDDAMEKMAKKGMGAVYTHGSQKQRIRIVQDREAVMQEFYDVHHKMFTAMVAGILNAGGSCLVVDGHSFSAIPLLYEAEQSVKRPDICIGTDSYHTPAALIEVTGEFFKTQGLQTALNTPYAGAIVPGMYYQKDKRVQSIMIEVNRSLYMDEYGKKTETFPEIQKVLKNYCHFLAKEKLR